MRRITQMLLAALMAAAILPAAGFGSTLATIGYTRLQTELGSGVATGSGVRVAMAEALWIGGPNQYYPNTAHAELAGRTFIPGSGARDVSSHATEVARRFFGSTMSVAPGVNHITTFTADGWLAGDYLRAQSTQFPLSTTARVVNHSWVAGVGGTTHNVLQRTDFLVERDELIHVVGVNNLDLDGNPAPMDQLAGAFNVLSVGMTNGRHSPGTNFVSSLYTTGRTRPHLVVPETVVSRAAPYVSGAAALLVDLARRQPGLSNGSIATTADRNNLTLRHGETSEVVRALLLAGADRRAVTAFNNGDVYAVNTPSGLNAKYGAGQLDVYHAYRMLMAGEQDSRQAGRPADIKLLGFDYEAAFRSDEVRSYHFSVGAVSRELAVSLVWNQKIDLRLSGGVLQDPNPKHLNLNVVLRNRDTDELVASSLSTSDTMENLYLPLLAAGNYEIIVSATGFTTPFTTDFALAWRFTPSQTPQIGDVDLDGRVTLRDVARLRNSLGTTSRVVWTDGDLDANGKVDLSDLRLVSGQFGMRTTNSPARMELAAAAVPEPSSLLLVGIGIGAIVVGVRRRARRGASVASRCAGDRTPGSHRADCAGGRCRCAGICRAWGAVAILFLAATAALALPRTAAAGGGPENVLLVVNANSQASKTIANHYARLRQIPLSNIVHLDWDGSLETIPVATFREKILAPVVGTMAVRGIAGQIDYVIYSSDLPYAVDLAGDGPPTRIPEENRKFFASTGSITGLTYLWQMVMAGGEASANAVLPGNHYVQQTEGYSIYRGPQRGGQSHGFRNWYGWGTAGERRDAGGQHYLLSAMLAVTTGGGNTVPEVIQYLTRSAEADGTRPAGTIYLVRNPGDVHRSGPRHDLFPRVVAQLSALGVRGEIVEGAMPTGKTDVQGTMMGVGSFKWNDSQSTIRPGAICEHLTSFGGRMQGRGSQTALSEFLRHGAAGASGTVVEPYNLLEKFPHPMMHVHYARGCTLAEAFYQSVFCPYQLLIVGDPLCRPWARIPQVTAIASGEAKVSGQFELQPLAVTEGGTQVGSFELFVNGVRHSKCRPGEMLTLDTTHLPDGHHELRVVAIDATPIETQGRVIMPLVVSNHGHSVELFSSAPKTVRHGQSLVLRATAPGAAQIKVLAGVQDLGTIIGAQGRITVDPAVLGEGPVVLRALALEQHEAGPRVRAVSKPIELVVTK